MPAPRISVIVPVRDNPEGIDRLLAALAAQTLPHHEFEVLIADDGSQPHLRPQPRLTPFALRILTCPPRNSYAARNTAFLHAQAPVLAFCDSDCTPHPRWLASGLAAVDRYPLAAGHVRFTPPPQPTIWTLLTIDMFLDQERDCRQSCAVTANLFSTTELFLHFRGFGESLPSGGDYDFVHRACHSHAGLGYAPAAIVSHSTFDARRPFLKKVWFSNYWAAVRRARSNSQSPPRLARTAPPIPILGSLLARRYAARPTLGLHRPRLLDSSLTPSLWHHILATLLLITVISATAGFARLSGYSAGRSLARGGHGPRFLSSCPLA